jgi:ribonuclease PH
MTRQDDRAADAVRPTRITPDFTVHAEGSVLIEVGRTRVICTASVEERGVLVRRYRQVHKVARGGAREEGDRTVSYQVLERIGVPFWSTRQDHH